MTVGVDDELRIREYPGDDTATPRAYGFKILDEDDLRVTRTNTDGSETVLVRGTHFSVSGAGNPTGGNVTPLAPIAAGTSWRIEGDMSLGQPTDYTAGDDFPAESHERGLDRSMIAHQEARRDIEDTRTRAVMLPRGEDAGLLPSIDDLKGKFPAVNADGDWFASEGTGNDAAFRTDAASTDPAKGLALFGTPYNGSALTVIDRSRFWTPLDFPRGGGIGADYTAALIDWASSGEKLAMPRGDYEFRTDAPLLFDVPGTRVEWGNGRSRIALGQRNPGRGMIEVTGDDCVFNGLVVTNPDLFKSDSGPQSFGVYVRANRFRGRDLTILDFEECFDMSAGASPLGAAVEGEFYDLWIDGGFARVLGVGHGTPDDAGGHGEDRGGGWTIWGARANVSNTRAFPSAGTDCRSGFFFEGLDVFAADTSGIDNAAIGFIHNCYVGADEDQTNAGGRFRRGYDLENYRRALLSHCIARGTATFAFQLAGDCSGIELAHTVAIMDCPANNANGASWSPNRAAYHFYPNGNDVDLVKLTDARAVFHTAGFRGIVMNGLGGASKATNIRVDGMDLIAANPALDLGAINCIDIFDFDAGSEIELHRVAVRGRWNVGLKALNIPTLRTEKVKIRGTDDLGMSVQGVTAWSSMRDEINDCGSGIETVGVTMVSIHDLTLSNLATFWLVNAGVTEMQINGLRAKNGVGIVSNFGTLNITEWVNVEGFIYMAPSSTYDPASLATGAVDAVQTVTATGAKKGDVARLVGASEFLAGATVHPWISAADELKYAVQNVAGANPLDLPSITLKFKVERRP